MFENNLTYHVFEDYNIPFDEKGATCGTIRKVQWVKEGNQPDESKAKIEIRKISVKDNDELKLKGYTFATPEGPGELITGMIKAGFGDTKEILKATMTRSDFIKAANTISDDEIEEATGEMFDMRSLLENMGMEVEEVGEF